MHRSQAFFQNKSVGLSTPTSLVLKRDGVQSEDWNALPAPAQKCAAGTHRDTNDVVSGYVCS